MKKFRNYLIAASLVFSAAVFGASFLDQGVLEKSSPVTSNINVDQMGNTSSN